LHAPTRRTRPNDVTRLSALGLEHINILAETRSRYRASSGEASFMAMGDGTHELPVEAELRRLIGKEERESVTIVLKERISRPHERRT
jgi:hypothetical protein